MIQPVHRELVESVHRELVEPVHRELVEPIDAPVSQEWGLTRFARDNSHVYPTPGHCGRDYASWEGVEVRVPEDGLVTHVGPTDIRAWGYVVSIAAGGSALRRAEGERHGDASTSSAVEPREERTHYFCHLQSDSATVAEGDEVKAGDPIARSGGTPNWPPHLHWEIRGGGPEVMNGSIDPRTLLHPDRYTQAALRAYAKAAAEQAGIDAEIFARQINQESGWNIYAHSPAAAIGIAQIVPRWHPTVNPWDAYAALDYAAALMASHLGAFGSYELALAAYNAGPTAVRRYGGVPPFRETRNYVNSILSDSEVKAGSVPSKVEGPVSGLYDDPDFWLKSNWEELAQTAIQVVNRARADVTPTDDESRFLNNRYKDLIDDWPRLMEAERQRAEVTS